jgi:RNA polymerase sigma-70 factor (ECF subfamily)
MYFTDEELICGLREGRREAAQDLCKRLRPVIDRTLRRVFPECEDHDDLVQSALERVVRTLIDRRFAGACSLSTWASTIAAHMGIDAMRSRTRERGLFHEAFASSPDVLAAQEPVTLERRLEARSELLRLSRLLQQLKPEQSLTLLLHDVLGHDLNEIANATGVTTAAAQSRLVRGRKELMRQRSARRSLESLPDEWLQKIERVSHRGEPRVVERSWQCAPRVPQGRNRLLPGSRGDG